MPIKSFTIPSFPLEQVPLQFLSADSDEFTPDFQSSARASQDMGIEKATYVLWCLRSGLQLRKSPDTFWYSPKYGRQLNFLMIPPATSLPKVSAISFHQFTSAHNLPFWTPRLPYWTFSIPWTFEPVFTLIFWIHSRVCFRWRLPCFCCR